MLCSGKYSRIVTTRANTSALSSATASHFLLKIASDCDVQCRRGIQATSELLGIIRCFVLLLQYGVWFAPTSMHCALSLSLSLFFSLSLSLCCSLRTQSLKILPLKPVVDQYIAIHAMLVSRDFFLANFYPSGPFPLHFFQNLSRTFPVGCG